MRIVEGLDLPIEGTPEQVVSEGPRPKTLALVGCDYIGLRPTLAVAEGDPVRLGQVLFADKRHPKVLFTSPGSGVVKEINRGARRALNSVVVELDGTDEESFSAWEPSQLATLRNDQVVDNLCSSGLWSALRARPFGRVADPSIAPSSIFVTAADTNPLAAKPAVVIGASRDDFLNGLRVVARLTDAPVFFCHAPDLQVPEGIAANVSTVAFSGPHPSGLVGTHIHYLDPVGLDRTVWHLGYQDVIAIGALFTTGRLRVERVVSLAGPQVQMPRLIRAPLGASTDALTQGELREGRSRIISGSALSGRQAQGPLAYLGRYHDQISVLAEGGLGDSRGWLMPGRGEAFSAYRLPRPMASQQPRFAMTTALHGETAPLYPLGGFERVMPLDILPTPLLRALLVQDLEMAQGLGCLELEEEDLALCSFVCPGKCDYGTLLRACLEAIEKGD